MEDYKTEQELDEKYRIHTHPALLNWYSIRRNIAPSIAKFELMKEISAVGAPFKTASNLSELTEEGGRTN